MDGILLKTKTVYDYTLGAISNRVNTYVDMSYQILDTCLYYIINMVMLFFSFTDIILDTSQKILYNYEIISTSIKHHLFDNIN